MKKKYKVLAADFDLTLADTSDVLARTLQENAEYFGYHMKYEDMLKGIGCLASVIYTRAGVSDPVLAQQMDERYAAAYEDYNAEHVNFFPDVVPGLKKLREHGIKVCIFSQRTRNAIIKPLTANGMLELFDFIVGYKDVKNTKPDPEGMRLIESALGVVPEDILYIGDAVTDQQTAENSGVDFAVMLTGITGEDAFDENKRVGLYRCFEDLCRDLCELS